MARRRALASSSQRLFQRRRERRVTSCCKRRSPRVFADWCEIVELEVRKGRLGVGGGMTSQVTQTHADQCLARDISPPPPAPLPGWRKRARTSGCVGCRNPSVRRSSSAARNANKQCGLVTPEQTRPGTKLGCSCVTLRPLLRRTVDLAFKLLHSLTGESSALLRFRSEHVVHEQNLHGCAVFVRLVFNTTSQEPDSASCVEIEIEPEIELLLQKVEDVVLIRNVVWQLELNTAPLHWTSTCDVYANSHLQIVNIVAAPTSNVIMTSVNYPMGIQVVFFGGVSLREDILLFNSPIRFKKLQYCTSLIRGQTPKDATINYCFAIRTHECSVRRDPGNFLDTFSNKLDSTTLCVLEPQSVVHWLQLYHRPSSTGFGYLFSCRFVIGSNSPREPCHHSSGVGWSIVVEEPRVRAPPPPPTGKSSARLSHWELVRTSASLELRQRQTPQQPDHSRLLPFLLVRETELNREIWAALANEVLRADETGAAPERKDRENGKSPRKPADQRHRPARVPFAKIRERPSRGLNPVRLGGATVAERSARSPSTKMNRVQSPAGSPDFRVNGNRVGRCRWSAGFLLDLPFPQPLHSGADPCSLQSHSSALKTSMLRAAQISSLTAQGQHCMYDTSRRLSLYTRSVAGRHETTTALSHTL
ncbi:hypothetical protein PR048_000907 [Dryococelus australis]|uniref:Uncharacterized protein n=1 Tax=Dryococelus australis TaxID=614101 RepID=A0ABQ9IFY9_9NEOP|nr:hypothetical protein PR048_000907 [Dryococelus australis]